MRRNLLAGMGIGVLMLTGAASAGASEGAYVVTRSSPRHETSHAQAAPRMAVHGPERERVYTVQRHEVVEPAAVVSEALSRQPVHTHLVNLVVVNTPITVDPQRDFTRPTGGIDEGHYLREAQRQWHRRQAAPARVVRNPHLTPSSHVKQDLPTPRAIIHVPDGLKQQPSPNDNAPHIPSVPALPQPQDRGEQPSLVRAE